jgi:hypothetical protein
MPEISTAIYPPWKNFNKLEKKNKDSIKRNTPIKPTK